RIIFNAELLPPLKYRNQLLAKKGLKEIIADCYKHYTNSKNLSEDDLNSIRELYGERSIDELARLYGSERTAEQADKIKSLGFKYATRGGMTVGINDVEIPPQKAQILTDSESRVTEVEKQFRRGLITEEEQYREIVEIWQKATKETSDAVKNNLNPFGPVAMMVNSSARGNPNQLS